MTMLPILEPPRGLGERCCDADLKTSLDATEAARLTAALGLLSHPIRLRLLAVLTASEGHVCVCDLEAAVPVKQPTVSHHLKQLRSAGLIESEKRGLWVYYRVRREALRELRGRIEAGLGRLGGADE